MEEITNHNMCGLCSESFCDNLETQFLTIHMYGMDFLIGFCEKHADLFEQKISEETQERFNLNKYKTVIGDYPKSMEDEKDEC